MSQDKQTQGGTTPSDKDQPLQGEGNYAAARRHRESVEQFVESGKVAEAAEQAAPKDDAEARDLKRAEEAGKAAAKP